MSVTLGPVREDAVLETELVTRSMGGQLTLRVATPVEDGDRAERDLRMVAGRIEAWAGRLTRFSPDSDLSALNAQPEATAVALRPTIGAVLAHARAMVPRAEGAVDVTLLDERLAAETGERAGPIDRPSWQIDRPSWQIDRPSWQIDRPSWQIDDVGRGGVLLRHGRVRFDLDGVAKGWIADRALRLLDRYRYALVDADGDVAVRAPRESGWRIAVGHPHTDRTEIARLGFPATRPRHSFGVATSGTSVHRWRGRDGAAHHLIDPLSGRPAVTDVVQATVVAESAAVAECLAKAAVIRGSEAGLGLLERAGAYAALLWLEDGQLTTTPGTSSWTD